MRCLSALLALLISVPVRPAAAAPAELNIVVLEGEGATNNIRQRVSREPIIQVQDENHRPVAGAAVVFTLPSRGAGGVFANGSHTLTTVTDNQGQAVARGLQANGAKGQYQIRVNVSSGGKTATANITMLNVAAAAGAAGAAAAGISTKLIVILVLAGAAVAGGAVAATQLGGGNNGTTAPPVTSATTITAGAGAVGPPR